MSIRPSIKIIIVVVVVYYNWKKKKNKIYNTYSYKIINKNRCNVKKQTCCSDLYISKENAGSASIYLDYFRTCVIHSFRDQVKLVDCPKDDGPDLKIDDMKHWSIYGHTQLINTYMYIQLSNYNTNYIDHINLFYSIIYIINYFYFQ